MRTMCLPFAHVRLAHRLGEETLQRSRSLRVLPVGVPGLLQEGHGGGAADGAQAHRPAGGWRQEASQEEADKVEDAWLMLSRAPAAPGVG